MAAEHHVETERKYQVDDAAVVPLGTDEPGPRIGDVTELQLDAVYFDTPGLDLHRRGVTLRRRTGGDDEGWQVKIPRQGDSKAEIRHPLGRSLTAAPRAVVDPVRAIVRDQPLVAVATIATHRTAYTVVHQGEPAAILCDDRVSARSLLDGKVEQAWREWELEVVEGQPADEVFAAVEPVLRGAGAQAADHGSKLGRAVAQPGGDIRTPKLRQGRQRSMDELLGSRLTEQAAALHEHDAEVRGGSPEGVHRMRIAARRLRSALTTTKPLFEEWPEAVVEELRWLGQELSPARDAQVIRQRLETALAAESRDLVLGPVRSRLRLELTREQREGLARAREALESTRYYRLLDALDLLVADLPLAPGHRKDARSTSGVLVKRDAKRLRRAVRAVDDSAPEERDHALHEARKKAKRLRYAAELATMAGGRRAKKLEKHAKAVQQALGQHQDSVVARRRLRRLGAQSFLHGENGFTFGLLHGVERMRSDQAIEAYERAWARMPGPRKAAAWASKR